MYNIAVIGGGVIGLTTAVQLQKDIKNAKITIFSEKLSPETTGDISAGFWTPYLLENTSENDITRWSKVTHDYLHRLWKQGFAKQAGICLIPTIKLLTENSDFKIPKWINIPYGSSNFSVRQVQKFNQQHGTEYSAILNYITFTCEPTKLLPFLMDKFIKNGGTLIKKRVNYFNEIPNDFHLIINCTGLNARELAQDTEMYAIRGQISRVQAPWQFHIIMDESSGHYIIPNTNRVILGGTHQLDENLLVCSKDKNEILSSCVKLAPGLKNCDYFEDGVGLRPSRNKVRLELELFRFGGETVKVIHNYGHGGAGVTLSVGCAHDASHLARSALGIHKFKANL